MATPDKKAGRKSAAAPTTTKRERNVLYVTMDDATARALEAFIAAQPAPPTGPSTGLSALIKFLKEQGFDPKNHADPTS
jgi:hypothetical protein